MDFIGLIFEYLHIHLPSEQFTNAKMYGIIKRVIDNENYIRNKHSISNIHIN